MLFDATSVAVVGASSDPTKVGGSVLANLIAGGFPGRIVPVNAQHATVQGLPAVASIDELTAPVDVAVVVVPAPAVQDVLEQCVTRGVPAAVVISAGFGESGAEGRAREERLRTWLARQPIRVLGPNCLGWMRPSRHLNLTFAPGMPAAGGIGFFSQSGALCTAILDWSRDHFIGFSLFASLGNQVNVTETDVLAELAGDPETRVILGYVEGVADGRAFFGSLREAAAGKPCVLLKSGRSTEGARAISSHTGALAGSDRAFEAAVRQAGALRADTVEELFDLGRALERQPVPRHRRVHIVTNGGGLGILATDAARDARLELPPLPPAARVSLARALPPHAALGNPLDLIGDATAARYDVALRALADDDAACVVMLAPQAATDAAAVARTVVAATRGWSRPALAVFAGGARVRPGVRVLEEGGIPCYPFPERAMWTLAGMATLGERRAAVRVTPIDVPAATPVLAGAARSLTPADTAALLRSCGMRTARAEVVPTADAARAAAAIGFPVALKIVSPAISHKTDVGGVRLGLRSPGEVMNVAADMIARVSAARPDARVDGVLVQEMAPPDGVELLLGMVRDPQFGPLVMIGAGGIYVELLGDTATRLAPIGIGEAAEMLDELRLAPALRGARGRRPVDLEAVASAVSRFSMVAASVDRLRELEINPLIVSAAGVMAIDARGTLD